MNRWKITQLKKREKNQLHIIMNPYIQPIVQIEPNIARMDVPMMKVEMPDASALKKVAYVEIFLYILLSLYIYNKVASYFYINEVSQNQQKFKSKPGNLLSGDTEKAGMSRKGGFVEIIVRFADQLFGSYKKVFNSIFGSVSKVAMEQGSALNRMRKFMQPLRIFIKSVVDYFYKKLENIMIGSLYMYHKMRDLILRSFASFNLVFYTLEHLVNTLQSFAHSDIVKLLVGMERFAGGISRGFNRLCFPEKTPIQLISGEYIYIKDALCGQHLKDGSVIKTVFKFVNSSLETLYELPTGDMANSMTSVYSTGSHIIFDKYENGYNKWKQVKDFQFARKTTIIPDYLYSISTSNNQIQIGNYTFADYEEISHSPTLIYLINLMQLQSLNRTSQNIPLYTYSSIQLDNGLAGHTLVKMLHGGWKPISEIGINDYLESPSHRAIGETMMLNRVIGTAELYSPSYSKYLWNGIMCTGNSKVYEPQLDIWMNVEVSMNAKLTEKSRSSKYDAANKTVRYNNLFTTTGCFIVYDPVLNAEVVWRDFTQIQDAATDDWVEERILCELNSNEIKKTRL